MTRIPNKSTTAKHLSERIPEILKSYGLNPTYCSLVLERTFGEKIHKQIDGFIRFSEDNDLEEDAIKSTLCHDLGGGLNNDEMMLPRVSGYGDYVSPETENIIDDEEEEEEEEEEGDTTWDFWEEE